MVPDGLCHLAASSLCLALLILGVRTTADLEWPPDPDHFRDIAQAQTMRDGAWLQDPSYNGESSLYNPLLASSIAAISYLTGQPVHVVATRAGAHLNVAAPATFYLLVCRLLGPPTALISLVGFVFLVRGPTWATPTYSPWLFASIFAQPFFYLTLTAYYGAIAGGRRWRYVVTGLLLGVTFLAHTAPAMIALVCILAVAGYRCGVERHEAREALGKLGLIAGPAILLAVPFLSTIVGRYRLRISNPIPLMWRDPGLPTDLLPLVSTVVGSRGTLRRQSSWSWQCSRSVGPAVPPRSSSRRRSLPASGSSCIASASSRTTLAESRGRRLCRRIIFWFTSGPLRWCCSERPCHRRHGDCLDDTTRDKAAVPFFRRVDRARLASGHRRGHRQ